MKTFVDYTKNNELLEKNYITNYVAKALKETNTTNLVKDILFITNENKIAANYIAGYIENKNILVINTDKILENIKIRNYNIQQSNTFILEILNHELTHVLQKAIVLGQYNSKKQITDELSKNTYLIENNYDLYMKNSIKFLVEYNAIIESKLKTMKQLYNTDLPKDKQLLENIKSFLTIRYNNTSPKKEFDTLLKRNNIEPCAKKLFMNLTNEEKTLYGYNSSNPLKILK